MFKNYFRKDISPSCIYCEHNKKKSTVNNQDALLVSCIKLSNKNENNQYCNFLNILL